MFTKFFLLFTLCWMAGNRLPANGQTSTFHDEITQVFPFSNTAVTLTPSWIKDRETLNIQYLKSLNADRLLHNFRVNAGLKGNMVELADTSLPIGLSYKDQLLNAIKKM